MPALEFRRTCISRTSQYFNTYKYIVAKRMHEIVFSFGFVMKGPSVSRSWLHVCGRLFVFVGGLNLMPGINMKVQRPAPEKEWTSDVHFPFFRGRVSIDV